MKYHWQQLVTDLIEQRVCTQTELGDACGASQTSVSAWVAGRRVPTRVAQRRLLEVARESGLPLEVYTSYDRSLMVHEPHTAWQVSVAGGKGVVDRPELVDLVRRLHAAPPQVCADIVAYVDFRLVPLGL